MILNLLCISIIVGVVLILLELIKYDNQEDEFLGVYECGYDSMGEARFWFSNRFFLLGILFIVFDVEISLMLSAPYLGTSLVFLFIIFGFVLVLLLGTIYEIEMGSMEWM